MLTGGRYLFSSFTEGKQRHGGIKHFVHIYTSENPSGIVHPSGSTHLTITLSCYSKTVFLRRSKHISAMVSIQRKSKDQIPAILKIKRWEVKGRKTCFTASFKYLNIKGPKERCYLLSYKHRKETQRGLYIVCVYAAGRGKLGIQSRAVKVQRLQLSC